MKRRAVRQGKLVRFPLQITLELLAFTRENYPVSGSGDVWQAFAWRDAQGRPRRVRLYFEDGLQLDASFGPARDGHQTIGNYSMKWNLIIRNDAA